MADISLDEYIGKRKMKGQTKQRLGPKSPPGRGRGAPGGRGRGSWRGRGKGGTPSNNTPMNKPGTQFNVVGLGKFDARQKISNNPLKTTVQDAREKIRARTFDARQKIDKGKKVDVRQKIETLRAQKDARSKIKPRAASAGNPVQKSQAQSVSMARGSLAKTIRTSNTAVPLTRTVNNEASTYHHVTQPVSKTRDYSSDNLVITRRNMTVSKPTPQLGPSTIGLRSQRSPSRNWSSIQTSMRQQTSTLSTVVKNDMYLEDDLPEYTTQETVRGHAQPLQPNAVRAAIQRVSVRHNMAENQPQTLHADSMNSLHGYRVLVTNLHPIVTEDDIVELFAAVGALKKARLLKPGTAEVVFVTKAEAQAAVRKYHLRELDGLPMRLALATRGAQESIARPIVEQSAPPAPSAQLQAPQTSGGPLRLGRSSEAERPSTVDPTLIHRALFKTAGRDEPPTRPVTFTVKI